MNCPNYNRALPPSEINIQKDVAHCSSCNHVFKISENIESLEDDVPLRTFDPTVLPQGVAHKVKDDGIHISIKTGNFKTAFFLYHSL